MIDVSRLWVAEYLVIGFFLYLIVLARLSPLTGRQRGRVLMVGLVCIALTIMLSQLRLSPLLRIAREWLPAIYLIQGYWLCGLFFRRPMLDWEARLMALDIWLFRVLNVRTFLTHGPRVVLEYFELTYLLTYPFVPVAFGLFCWLGFRDGADHFWTALLFAGYGTYGVLPWIQTRPPRAIERDNPLDARGLLLHRLNVGVLARTSVQVNTFPSGHASTGTAAALAVASLDPVIGGVLLFLAISLIVATVLGRYHYAWDSILGGVVGIAAWWVGFRLLPFP